MYTYIEMPGSIAQVTCKQQTSTNEINIGNAITRISQTGKYIVPCGDAVECCNIEKRGARGSQ